MGFSEALEQANSSFFITTIKLLSVHLDVQMPLEICIFLGILLVVVVLFRGRVLSARMGCSLLHSQGRSREERTKNGLFFPSKQARQFGDLNSNVGSCSVFTMQLFLKAFSTLAILHMLSRKFYISYIIKSSKQTQRIEISDYI